MSTTADEYVFFFSDIESSTKLWERFPTAMQASLEKHDAILNQDIVAAGGSLVKTTGDGAMAVFSEPAGALEASLRIQRDLDAASWGETGPLHIRIGLHQGVAQEREGDFFGPPVNRTARIMAAASGGQTLLSARVATALSDRLPPDISLRDLGEHRLKDLAAAEHVFQLVDAELPGSFPPLSTLDRAANNLPTQISTFLGRARELDEVRELIDAPATRLITLIGPGGTGKTRLGLQAVAESVDRFEDGAYFVDLSLTDDAESCFAEIARTIGIELGGDESALGALRDQLSTRRTLLLLDNFEQVTEAAAGVAALLQECPSVEIVVTSRQALRVRGERLYSVEPLSVPDDGASLSEILASESVQLFVDRANSGRSSLTVDETNARQLASICSQLDGLPLALELAAARLGVLSVADLQTRLVHALDLLKGGARDLPSRQQTLRSTIAWSYDLLDPLEKLMLQAASVFAGAGFGEMEEVAARVEETAGCDVIDLLESLVEKSLIRPSTTASGRTWFSMLDTIAEFASEQLRADENLEERVRQAHAEFFVELAASRRPELSGPNRAAALGELGRNLGNLRQAWDYWLEREDLARLHDLLDTLWIVHDSEGWYHGTFEIARDLLEVLQLQPETPDRIREEIAVQTSLARSLMTVRGYTEEVEQAFFEALRKADESGSAPDRFPVLRNLASLYLFTSHYDKSTELGRDLLTIAEAQDDPALKVDANLIVGTSLALTNEVEIGLEYLDRAISDFEPSRMRGDRFKVGPDAGIVSLTSSAFLLWVSGFPDRAVARCEHALRAIEELGHPYSKAYGLYHVAFLDLTREDFEACRRHAAELLTHANSHDYPLWRALAMLAQGVATSVLDDPDAGLAEVERAIDLYQGLTSPPAFWSTITALRATAHGLAGDLEKAIELIEMAVATSSQLKSGFHAQQMQVQGDLLAMAGRNVEALEAYEGSLALATELDARMVMLTGATRLARAHAGTSEQAAALARLEEILSSFTEGFDSAPLIEARGILDAV